MAKHEQFPITTPGIYAGISNQDYHGGPGISKSSLDLIRKSPLHFKAAKDAGPRESTPSQQLGTMVHDLVLEPATFWDRYARPFEAPEGALATVEDIKERLKALGVDAPSKAKKDDLKALLAAADPTAVFLDDAKTEWAFSVDDKIVVSAEDLAKAEAMAASVMAHPIAGKLFAPGSGEPELSCYAVDKKTGVLCRCRPDWWRTDGIVVDLKTTKDASPEGFARAIHDWGYHKQDPFYTDVMGAAIKQSGSDRAAPRAFVFVAVESTRPFAVGVYRLEAESVEIGRREIREDVDTYAACAASDVWPGYGDKIQPIGLPEWRIRREMFEGEV